MLSKVANLLTGPVRYLEAGSGARTVVLIHGFPLSAEQWLPQLARPEPGWRLVAPDLRGFRGTASALEAFDPGETTIDDYAQDVVDLMAQLDIDRAVIAGLSMGGYVALAIVRRAPKRVAGLVLANTRAGADSADGRAARDRMIALLEREGPQAVARDMLPKLLGETTRREQPDLLDAVQRLIEANTAEGLIAAVRAMKNRQDSTPQLASITCPTLVITGAEDVLIPVSESEAMHRAIPSSRLVVLPHAGHLSNLEGWGAGLFSTVSA